MVLEALNEGFRAGEGFFGRLVVWCGEADDGLAEDTANPYRLRRASNLLFEVVHIGIGRRAAERHLDRAEHGAPIHEFRRDVLRLGGKDVILEPFEKAQIVGDATKKRHRRVAMRVDESRDDEMAVRMDCLPRSRPLVLRREHRDDLTAPYGDRTSFENPHVRIHRHDGAARNEDVYGLLRRREKKS